MLTLRLPSVLAEPFAVLEAGAAAVLSDAAMLQVFSRLQVVGFEPLPGECARLIQLHGPPHQFFPIMGGARTERRPYFLTPDPQFSSLLPPDRAILNACWERDLGFFPVNQIEVDVVDVGRYLLDRCIPAIQFCCINVPGGELDLLLGLQPFLTHSVLGMRIKVFVTPLYADQPLFGDIDSFLRARAFQLFALTDGAPRLHRRSVPLQVAGAGQLIALSALYLRNYHDLRRRGDISSLRTLAVLAGALGFHDYAVQVVQALLTDGGMNEQERTEVVEARSSYLTTLLAGGVRLE